MADEKLTDRTAASADIADNDLMSIVDVSDTSQDAAGSDYKWTFSKVKTWIEAKVFVILKALQFIESVQTLTDASSITWDWAQGNKAVVTLGGNRTLSNPTNKQVGTYTLTVIQDATGGRTLAFDTDYQGSATINTTANSISVIRFYYDGVKVRYESQSTFDARITANESDISAIDSQVTTNTAGIATLTSDKAGLSQTDFIGGVIEAPADGDYKLVVKVPYDITITETTTISTAGTCTATFKINTTALGGTANSVSTSEESQSHASSNDASAGDDIVLTVSSNSSCEFLSFTIKFTRTLA